jgi:SPP1 family holin
MNLKGVSKDTWVRIIVLALILVNQVSVTVFGNQILPFSDEQLYEGISTGLTIAVAIWTTWKNNSFTTEAQRADQLIKK